MKILFINQSDIVGGAARAAHRLATNLYEKSPTIRLLVMRKLGNNQWVVGPRSILHHFLSRILPRVDLILKQILGVNKVYSWSLNLAPNLMLDKNFINRQNSIANANQKIEL